MYSLVFQFLTTATTEAGPAVREIIVLRSLLFINWLKRLLSLIIVLIIVSLVLLFLFLFLFLFFLLFLLIVAVIFLRYL